MSASRHVAYMHAARVLSAVALAGAALAACGSTPANKGPGTAGGNGLCAGTTHIDRLVVKRINAIPQNHPHFTFPAKVTVSDPGQARAVARAVCTLPPLPSGNLSCPGDTGISYRLTFAARGKTLASVEVQASGCGKVRGLGKTRWTAHSPSFWRTLGTAMGIRNPDNSTFLGTTS